MMVHWFLKGVSSDLVSKDPASAFEPIGIRKGCFKYGHHVIYNTGRFYPLDITQSILYYHLHFISVLHHFGLLNEVQRPDRDDHLQVNTFALRKGLDHKSRTTIHSLWIIDHFASDYWSRPGSDESKTHFQKHSAWSLSNEGYPFDIGSIMMFDSYDFSKDRFKRIWCMIQRLKMES